MLSAHSSRLRRLPTAALAVLGLLVSSLVVGALPARAQATELFFSEYIEGSSNNKALEIFNDTGAAVDLAANGYNVQMFFNGSATAGLTINLTGTVADGDVHVLAQSAANATILAQADQTNGSGWFNGDDAVVLRKGTTVIDVIGQVGFDPGTEWGSGLTSTADNTLRRMASVTAGDTNGTDAFDPSVQWDGFATDTFDGLGAHSVSEEDLAPTVTSTTPGDGAQSEAPGANIRVSFSEDVDVADGWYAINCSLSGTHPATVSGGPTTYTLNPASDFAQGDVCTVTITGAAVTDEDTIDPPDTMAADYSWSFRVAACGDEDTLISAIQGNGATSPMVGENVTFQAIVTAIRPGLSGFFVQEEAADQDGDPSTSEGIFVRTTPPSGIAAGDVVQVSGTVAEFTGSGSSQTQVGGGATVLECGEPQVAEPAVLEFPVTDVSDFEHYEGMLVTLPQSLVISEYFNYGRFNEVVVGLPPNGRDRFDTPTAVVEPGPAATALAAEYARRRITVDDGRSTQNPTPPFFPGMVDTEFTLDNSFRGGDTLTDVTGVVEHTFGLYRVHPTEDATYSAENPRPQAPPQVGGNLKVASFNVLNYFLTPDAIPTDDNNNNPADDHCGGNANLDCRGADGDQPQELQRQRAKIVDAISRLDADVVGLMEMENTPGVEPAADLADGLNDATAAGTYDFIDTGVIGTDAIRLGFLYQPGAVTPVGDFDVLDSSDDPRFDDSRSRPALTQTFRHNDSGEVFTVTVNHLKSKGSACAGDPDTGDGSGNCNETRTRAAEALVDYLASDPTDSGDPDHLIIGDLNSYDHEDPIDVLVSNGFTDLVKMFGGEFAYSYVFDGQIGYLDHGLANQSLVSQVTGTGDWHINADEPSILDYDTSFKNTPEEGLYEPNAFRSSDHDPVLIGLELGVTQCRYEDDFSSKTRTLLNDCETSHSVTVPDGWTLDGDGHSITAVDPAGGHFTGAVVRNAGAVAHVQDLTVTAHDLADVCDAGDDRLRGILFEGAAGSITGNTVVGINQGESGCQEGNAIEVRNAPFDASSSDDKAVTVKDNVVRDYQKTGIVANGSVLATITGNTVEGAGPVGYIAQNGVQVGFGARATVDGNSIADNWYTGSDAVACGLLLYQADGVKQMRNTFTGNQRDVCNFGRGGGNVSTTT